MFCIHCGKEIPDTVKFCPYCGGNTTEDILSAPPVSPVSPGSPSFDPNQTTAGRPAPDWSAEAAAAYNNMANVVTDEVQRKRIEAERRREAQRKKNNQMVLIAIIIIAVTALAFVFVIAPKFLGMQLLPVDPFGFNKSAPAAGGDSGKSSTAAEEEETPKIKNVSIDVRRVVIGGEGRDAAVSDGGSLLVDAGAVITLRAVVGPEGAGNEAEYEWSVSGDGHVADYDWDNDNATIYALSSGEFYVSVEAVGSRNSAADDTLHIVIAAPAPPEDELYPFRGTIFVTNEPKLGIFVRSEHVVNGEGKKLNDGNKIGWIEGGNTSVELVATGNEYDEGPNGYWWYEVEIPQWYRDTTKQTENYKDKPLVGWVRSDVVREK
ncbi:hypothetical protein AGMMS49983_15050 [Clostridia bacterium]|nr:hypothetical protein AGMMS49983_15050 [Clostridia bacterium]